MEENNSYKAIFKSASLFGGVKLFQIIATIIRSKIIAIYLGANGMGFSGILVSTTTMIQSVSELGLSFSSVREISQSNTDESKLKRTISIFIRLLIISSFLGVLLLIIFSPFLSLISLGNKTYTLTFVALSLLILFNTLSGGLQSILQGTRQLKSIAKVTIISTVISVLISLPFYIYFGVKGIVPALILTAFSNFLLNYFFTRNSIVFSTNITFKELREEGKEMIHLGTIMVFVNLLGTIVPFLINAFIKYKGSIIDVGLYQAGLSLTTQYISLVFAAMTVDYFPRLSAINSDNRKVKELANQQTEIMLLIIIPLLSILIFIAPLLIKILLTIEFSIISNFVRLMSIGIFFQAASYSMGLISFAKGDKNTFVFLSIVGNASWIFFSILGYNFYGINGIGSLYILHSIICFLLVYFTINKKYNYSMSSSFINLLILGIISLTVIFYISFTSHNFYGYTFSIFLLIFISFFSLSQLNKKINFMKFREGLNNQGS